MIDITRKEHDIVLELVRQYFPCCEVRVFGSRYKGQAKPYSDLDLVLLGDDVLDWKQLAELKEAFQESELPFRVDVLDWHSLSPEFRKVIETGGYEVIAELKPSHHW